MNTETWVMSTSNRLFLSVLVVASAGTLIALAAPSLAAPSVHFADGRPAITLSSTASPLDLAQLAVGEQRRGSLVVTNSGSGRGLYLLQIEGRGSRLLLRRLELTVTAGSGHALHRLYRGSLAGVGTLQLGRLDIGERRRLSFAVSLRSSGSDAGDNALQGLAAGVRLHWSAVQE
jgi:hypothetical protein